MDAGGLKVFIHSAMLFADHVQPHPVWQQLHPGEGDGKVIVIVLDASREDLDNFIRKLKTALTYILELPFMN